MKRTNKYIYGILFFSLIVVVSAFSIFYYRNKVSALEKQLDDKNTVQEPVVNNSSTSKPINDNTLDFDDILVSLEGKVDRDKVQKLLGVPDKEGLAGRYSTYGGPLKNICLYAIYFDKVKSEGKIKHLVVLFWSHDYTLSCKAVVDGQKVFATNTDYIIVRKSGIAGPDTYECSFFGEITTL